MKTVCIIGAGASTEVGLPTGDGLKKQIASLLDIQPPNERWKANPRYEMVSGDKKIFEALNAHEKMQSGRPYVHPYASTRDDLQDIKPYLDAAWQIRDALPRASSIDQFIYQQQKNEKYDEIVLCGKLAIVRSILMAEQASDLFLEKKWYEEFFNWLTETCHREDLEERFKSIVLIIFNYDRCVEHFLYHALQIRYPISGDEAAGLVKQINIFHPYGSVGVLPWYGSIADETMEYGADPNPNKLLALTNKIKTFTEETYPDSSDILAMQTHMHEARRLVFLGFAFHELNIQLLSCHKQSNRNKTGPASYATTLDVSESNKKMIKRQILGLYRDRIPGTHGVEMANLKCCDFFNEFKKSLAF